MPDEKKWLCCGCGEPVDDDGFPTCKCPTDVLYKRGTNEHAIKPRPCATCGPRRETSFPKPSTMPDDAIERARECLAATPHDPHENCGRLNVVFARCTCDRHLRAMLAFASQQAPEGRATLDSVWLQAEQNHRTYSDTGDRDRDIQFLTLGLTGEAGEVANFVKKRWRDGVGHDDDIRKEIADVCAYAFMLANTMGMTPGDLMQVIADKQAVFVAKMQARPAMLDAAPSVTLGEVG